MSRRGGGGGSDKLFISNCITRLYEIYVNEIYYLFHAESAQNYLF